MLLTLLLLLLLLLMMSTPYGLLVQHLLKV
jgi:hypothetical protein